MTSAPHCLVVAKAPVPGQVKTRLAAGVGAVAAADLAAAALLDTLEVCAEAFGTARCHLALGGALGGAVRGDEIARGLAGWSVVGQTGATLPERLANTHAEVGASGGAPLVQVGMDTPQLGSDLLTGVAEGLRTHDAVVGPADDGGWWALALRRPAHACVLPDVPVSTPHTCARTVQALLHRGLRVGTADTLRDVDTVADADAVAALAPHSRFAQAWRSLALQEVR